MVLIGWRGPPSGTSSRCGGLRRRLIYRNERFRTVHLRIQHDHVHLIVEADDRVALAKGMQGFQVAAARYINKLIVGEDGRPRRGSVFPDRYHAVQLTTPTQVRHCVGYVLNNWRKHREDVRAVSRERLDAFASGRMFEGWRENQAAKALAVIPVGLELLAVKRPRTYLLEHGWKRLGYISMWQRPGPAPTARRTRPS